MERREAVRVVLLDQEKQVAIVHVHKYGYYKVPGGGIEPGETSEVAAQRETREETGCDSKIIAKLGHSETELPEWGMLDISEGFLAQIVGEKQAPQFDQHEKERDFAVEWFSSLEQAIMTIEANHDVADPNAAKLQARDLSYLKLAAEYLRQK